MFSQQLPNGQQPGNHLQAGSFNQLVYLTKRLIHAIVSILIFILLFIACGSTANAQSQIYGTVRNDSEKPVDNAEVVLLNAYDSLKVMSTMANEQGIFVFTNLGIGDYTILATAIGFEKAVSPMYSIISEQDDINAGVLILQVKQQKLIEVVLKTNNPLFKKR